MKLPDALKLALQVGAEHGAPRSAVHYALAVSTLETENGDWTRIPAGQGSNNMGSIGKYAPEQPSFTTGDKHADGSGFQHEFRIYPTPLDGYRDFWAQLMHKNVLQAAMENSGTKAVALQYANGYFEADPGKYGALLADVYARVLQETGEPRLLNFARVGMLKKKTVEQPPFQLAYSRPPVLRSPSSLPPSESNGASK